METNNIIIDCDPGLDDVLAIIMARHYFFNSIKAITTSYGNANVDKTAHNACQASSMLQLACPIFKGASKSTFDIFNRQLNLNWQSFGADDGLCGVSLKEFFNSTSVMFNDISTLQNIVHFNSEFNVIAIAPLTNIAETFPLENKDNIYIYTLGSYFNLKKVAKPRLSYNIKLDPSAASTVFNTFKHIIVTGLDIYGLWSENTFKDLFHECSKLKTISAKLLCKAVDAYLEHGMDPSALFVDSLPVFAAAHPEAFSWTEGKVTVNANRYPYVDFLKFTSNVVENKKENKLVRVATNLDIVKFKKSWLEILKSV